MRRAAILSRSFTPSRPLSSRGGAPGLAAALAVGISMLTFASAAIAQRAGNDSTSLVTIDPAMVQDLGVRTALVEPRVITAAIRTTGYVDYDQRLVTQVNARVSGWIEKLYVAYTGEAVRRGQDLLRIYSPELVLTQEDYLRARKLTDGDPAVGGSAVNDGTSLMAAARTRLSLWGIAPAQLAELDERGRPSETLPIEAPASGVVTDSKVVEGAYIKAGDSLYTIVNLSRVWVYADIYEREIPKVSIGQHAEVSGDALAGDTLEGIVAYIYPSVDLKTRTVQVRLELPNPGLKLRPGMYVTVTLLDEAPRQKLAVPSEAVLNSGVRQVVILSLGGGHYAPREVKIGAESDGYDEVLAGLDQGDRIVTSAQFLIDSESNLREALNAMAPGQQSAPPPTSVMPASGE